MAHELARRRAVGVKETNNVRERDLARRRLARESLEIVPKLRRKFGDAIEALPELDCFKHRRVINRELRFDDIVGQITEERPYCLLWQAGPPCAPERFSHDLAGLFGKHYDGRPLIWYQHTWGRLGVLGAL
jgi:hypothetical protein